MDLDDRLWRLYVKEILTHATSGNFDPNTHVFSPASIVSSISLGDFEPAVINWTSYVFGDAIPSATGSYSPASGLFISYWFFLSYAALGANSIKDSDMIKAYRQKLQQKHEEFIRFRKRLPVDDALNLFASKRDPESCSDIISSLGNDNTLENVHKRIINELGRNDTTASSLARILNNCFLASSQISNRYNMIVNLNTGNANSYCPLYSIRNFNGIIAKWKENAFAGRMDLKITLSISESDSTLQQQEDIADLPEIHMPVKFLNFYILGKDVSLAENLGSLSVEFAGFGAFDIEPGEWFDISLIETHKSCLEEGAPLFFDKNGSLNLLPQKIVIGFRPRVSLRICGDNPAQEMVDNLTSVGPFNISANSKDGVLQLEGKMLNKEVIVFDAHESAIPVLLGVISKWL